MSESPADDTAYVQDFFDRGMPVPAGEYSCPDGVVIPPEYVDRAKAAGRVPDGPEDMFRLSEGPAGSGAKLALRSGAYVILSGTIGPPPDGGNATTGIGIGTGDCAVSLGVPV